MGLFKKKPKPVSTKVFKTTAGWQTEAGATFRTKGQARKAHNAALKTKLELEYQQAKTKGANARTGRFAAGVATVTAADNINKYSALEKQRAQDSAEIEKQKLSVADRFLNNVTNKWDGKTESKDKDETSSSMTGWI